jgi:Histidine kinase-, DNA gyrase B-, and HSP90-like ATPase
LASQARRNGVVLQCNILDPDIAFDMEQYKIDACLDDVTAHANLMQSYTVVRASPSPTDRPSVIGGGSTERVIGGYGLQRALIDVDRRRIAYVLRNVVSNALNFTPTGGKVTVSLRLSRRMGPKVVSARLQSMAGSFRGSARGSSSIFGTPPRNNEDPATIENTMSNSERTLDGTYELVADGSPQPPSSRPVFFSRDRDSESIVLPPDFMSNPQLEGGRCRQNEEFPSTGYRRDPGTPQAPNNPAVFEEDDNHFSITDWLRKKKLTKNVKCKSPVRSVKKKGPSFLIVEVTDTGSGIAKENMDRIFKEIVQFNPDELHGEGHGGTGLGMVLSNGIVEAHGGKMWLTSEGLGKGCTFGFGLPLSRVQTHPDHRGRADSAIIEMQSNHGSSTEGADSLC